MEETPDLDRTWLCTVLFLDIVNYSSQSVQVQMEWKTFFNSSLTDALRSVPVADRVILDTGDGAAICFLGDPEAAMLCALALHGRFVSRAEEPSPPRVRSGINLGPVRLVKDINGNLNAIGDGINVGQRIMSFAVPNQILTSRSYYEVVSALTDDYRRLFRLGGTREDKHVREHVVYELAPALPNTPVSESPDAPLPSPKAVTPGSTLEPAPERRNWFVIGAAVVLACGVATVLVLHRPSPPSVAPSIPVSSQGSVADKSGVVNEPKQSPQDNPKPKDIPPQAAPTTTQPTATATAPQPSPTPEPRLRTASSTVSVDQAKAIVVEHDFYHARWNESGKGIKHQYRKQVLQGAIIVLDQATRLMWQQTGSEEARPSDFQGAERYVRGLNAKNFAGFGDWRLPTLEEAMSIMTTPQGGTSDEALMGDKTVKGVMHIDPVFDKSAAPFIWTSDLLSTERGWVVYYLDGICTPESLQFNAYMRAVRSVAGSP